MKRNKRSFTMVELLICLVIVGIIMALAVQAIKTMNSSYTTLTYKAFKDMQTIVNSMWEVNDDSPFADLDGENHSKDDMVVSKCSLADGTISSIIKPDTDTDYSSTVPSCTVTAGNTSDDSTFNFCKRIASMANITGTVNCDWNDTFAVSTATNALDGYEVPYLDGFDADSPNFTTTNGQRYYISRRTCNENKVAFNDYDTSKNYYCFRLIGVDLNGTRKPNVLSPRPNETGDTNRNKIPDIITFMIMDNGTIFPLGAAGNNKKVDDNKYIPYLNSRIKAYDYEDVVDDDGATDENVDCLMSNGLDVDVATKNTCAYKVRYILNDSGSGDSVSGGTAGSYRDKFCISGQSERQYYDFYCSKGSYTIFSLCPGGSVAEGTEQYDECYADPIKPLLKFNL